ncbi:MAG: bifunctional precorrin-2 dehydrogenase/sirohydrochlorin ferrochelatase [Blautia sp.]|nr:bifunctional precorrin-2 dehydrogenase/sirohydrochlorin ferrochelatase [Blautia sp.]
MKNKKYFPMFIDLSDRSVVIVGGGSTAVRRARTLLQFTRNVTVVTKEADQDLIDMARLGRITLHQRLVKRADLQNAFMVLTATSDRKLNDDIYRLCKDEGIYVNVSNDREKSDFQFPGVYIKNDLCVGVTATGLTSERAKKVSTAVQEAIEKALEELDE